MVLLFLFVRQVDQVWIIYVVSVLKFTLTSFFEPAREALVPDLVSREELVAANGISGLTWSVMLAGGAALGGLVVGTLSLLRRQKALDCMLERGVSCVSSR